ncbi:hypothetical protein, partial [Apilactobacillus apinorum]|uniref:hypothetical protein n=1 Tax=Apilactobacillus apinorum TaxID=1218495 RepID=UPI0033420235
MEDESYSILNQRAIIDLLIEGDIFPYMTGSKIQDIGRKFEASYKEGSRWQILQSILCSLHEKGKTSDFFYYYLFKMNITSAVRKVING